MKTEHDIDQNHQQVTDWKAPEPPAKPKRKMRKLTWAIIIFNALMLVWIVAGTGSAVNGADCANQTADAFMTAAENQELCEGATAIGAGIAVFGLLFLTMMVDVILGIIWLVTRKNHQH